MTTFITLPTASHDPSAMGDKNMHTLATLNAGVVGVCATQSASSLIRRAGTSNRKGPHVHLANASEASLANATSHRFHILPDDGNPRPDIGQKIITEEGKS